jgi:uncharacterized protein
VYALIDRDDAWHIRVRDWWERNGADVLLPVCVLPEICYLLASRLGTRAELAFMNAVVAAEFVVEPLLEEDTRRAVQLMEAYADASFGFVDAGLAATAERLDTDGIVTTDRRHFGMLRPRHSPEFRLLP